MKIAVQDAVYDMKNNGGADVKVSFVKFASGALTETDLTDDLGLVISDITSSEYQKGGTWTRQGYEEAKKQLDGPNARSGLDYRKLIVFLTDGKTEG